MSRRLAGVLGIGLLLVSAAVHAHRIDEVLQATLLTVEADHVRGSLRIVPGELVASTMIEIIDRNADGTFSADERAAYAGRALAGLSITIDGHAVQPQLVSSSFPTPAQMRSGLGELRIDYTIDTSHADGDRTLVLSNRHLAGQSVYLANVVTPRDPSVRIVAQKRSPEQSVYELDYRASTGEGGSPPAPVPTNVVSAAMSRWSGLFRLGMRHIAEGTDHLMFLLVLLLPAPLLVAGARWGRRDASRTAALKAVGIVTAFTVGHSITLGLSAIGGYDLAGRATEVLIAVSILVSAIHALWPLFPGREAVIAAAFGLVHGMAFGQALGSLGIERWDRVVGTLAFNLGIEAVQLVVVAAALPALLLFAKTAAYTAIRVGGALLAVAMSISWIVQRSIDGGSPNEAMGLASAGHLPWLVAILLVVGVLYVATTGKPGRREDSRSRQRLRVRSPKLE